MANEISFHPNDKQTTLLADRNIFLYGEINQDICLGIQKTLLYFDGIDDKSDINIYISGPGGSINDGLGLIDIMRTIKSRINVICVGQAASMSALIFLNGDRRYMMPNSQLMLHQPLGGASGQASDIELISKQILKLKAWINNMISQNSALDLKRVESITDRDCYIDAQTALEYGLADDIIKPTKNRKTKNQIKRITNV